jgi:hypothetical protein
VGEEVLAADFNQYVQQQVVATFATTAARSSAIPSPLNGMVTYVVDRQALEVYNGTAWVSANAGRRLTGANVSAADVTNGATTKVGTVSFSITATRLIRAEATVNYSIITANSNGNIGARLGFDNAQTTFFATSHGAGLGSVWGGSSFVWQSLAAGTHTADVNVVNAATTGCAARVTAGTLTLNVLDYG